MNRACGASNIEENFSRFDVGRMGMGSARPTPSKKTGVAVHEIELENEPSCLSTARTFVTDFLSDMGISENGAFDILLALNEAIANSLRHGRTGDRDRITVRCGIEEGDLIFTVRDNGPGFEFSRDMTELPDPLKASGRGLYLMSELMDRLDVDSSPRGTTVSLIRRCNDRELDLQVR